MVHVARSLGIDTLDGAHGHTLLDDHIGHFLVPQAEGFDAGVVAAVEAVVHDDADAESRAEGVSDEVPVLFRASERLETGVYLGQCAAEGLAVGKQVTVVVDEDRDAELGLEEGAESHTFAERGEVGQIAADDSVRVVGRAGEREADGDGFLLQFVDDGLKAFDHRCQTFVQVVGVRRQRDGIDDEFVGLHGAEHQVRAACVECDDHTVVVSVHGILVICWLWI